MIVSAGDRLSFGPGIDERYTRCLEVGRIARDDRHPLHDGRRCDQRVSLGTVLSTLNTGTALSPAPSASFG